MIPYTTPTYELAIEGANLVGADICVSFRQNTNCKASLDVTDVTVALDGEDSIVTFTLTQEQTGRFKVGPIKVQVNWILEGARNSTYVAEIPAFEQLRREVM